MSRPHRFVEGDEIDVRGHVARIAWIDDEGPDGPVALLVDASPVGGTPARPFAMTIADLGACLTGFAVHAVAPLDGMQEAEAA